MNFYSLLNTNDESLSVPKIAIEDLNYTEGYVFFDQEISAEMAYPEVKYIFYGDLSKDLMLREMNHYSFFFSRNMSLKEIKEKISTKNNNSKAHKSSYIINTESVKSLQKKKRNIIDINLEIETQKNLLKEVKGLRQYVIRLLEVKSVEDLILETEQLRFLRSKSVKVSLIHSTETFDTLYSRAGAAKLKDQKIKDIFSNKEKDVKLRSTIANFLKRPTLKYSDLFKEKTDDGDFYVIFESQEEVDRDDYFFLMLRKLLFTNFIRVVQSETLIRDANLISQSFKQINAKAAIITKDYKIRFSSDLDGLEKTCYHHLFNRVSPCVGCPLNKEQSGVFKLEDVKYTVNSSFVSTPRQKFSFHIYETIEEGRRRESIRAQRGKLKSLGVVTQSLTHELNNPLGGIFELSKELSSFKSGQLREDFEEVAKASMRCLEIINHLQSFASKKIKFSRINFSETVEKAMTFTKVLGRDINRRMDLDDSIWISGSDTLLQQVIFNLFKNSVEAMNGRGDVLIKLYKKGNAAVFEIQDSGPGFPKDMSNIELFGTQEKEEGTGLGLFLVKEFVHLHQADLDFGNLDTGGSYFKLIFHKLG